MKQDYLKIYLSNGRSFTTTRPNVDEFKQFILWRKKMLMEKNQVIFPIYDELLEAINNGNYKIETFNSRGRNR